MEHAALMLTIALTAGQAAVAGEVVKTPHEYLIPKQTGPIAIDGTLREWDMKRSPYVISTSGTSTMNTGSCSVMTHPD